MTSGSFSSPGCVQRQTDYRLPLGGPVLLSAAWSQDSWQSGSTLSNRRVATKHVSTKRRSTKRRSTNCMQAVRRNR